MPEGAQGGEATPRRQDCPDFGLNVVLVAPEIPPNTGNIGRLCLATGSRLHLVRPLGFDISARAVQRAGLDYWPEVDKVIWEDRAAYVAATATSRRFLLTTKCDRPYWDADFQPGDHLVFGAESRGLPESWLHAHPESCLTIPMRGARSLNLATAVGIVLYEAIRQLARRSGPV